MSVSHDPLFTKNPEKSLRIAQIAGILKWALEEVTSRVNSSAPNPEQFAVKRAIPVEKPKEDKPAAKPKEQIDWQAIYGPRNPLAREPITWNNNTDPCKNCGHSFNDHIVSHCDYCYACAQDAKKIIPQDWEAAKLLARTMCSGYVNRSGIRYYRESVVLDKTYIKRLAAM